MSAIQRVCGTARVSYMCACGDVAALEPCGCFVSVEWLGTCAVSSVCASMPKHRAMCLWIAWAPLCSCACESVSACVSVCARVE